MLKILLIAVLLTFCETEAHSQEPPPRTDQHQATDTESKIDRESSGSNQHGGQAAPFVPLSVIADAAPPGRHQGKHHNKSAESWWIIIPTWLLAIFTGLLFYFTFKLWRSTSALVEEADKTSRSELRAYLGVQGGSIHLSENKEAAWADIDLPNSGKTPAHRVQRYISMEVSDTGRTNFPEPQHRPGSWPIAPGAVWKLTDEIKFREGELDAIENGVKTIFVWGKLTYIDAFDKGTTRTVRFRYRLWHKIMGQRRAATTRDTEAFHEGWMLDPTPDGNSSD